VAGDPLLRIEGITKWPDRAAVAQVQVFADAPPFDLDLQDNQVTVLLGLLGSGKTELLEWMFGARAVPDGERELGGDPFAPTHPADAVARGVYLLPESRNVQAIIPGWSVSEQMTLPFLKRFSSGTRMRAPAERRATILMSAIGIVARGPSSPIQTLSGGNQQKVVIGRWLLGSPRVLQLVSDLESLDDAGYAAVAETMLRLSRSLLVEQDSVTFEQLIRAALPGCGQAVGEASEVVPVG
jgi:simple sugar transport system ATP-binding protein